MSSTGNVALSMMLQAAVVAPVRCQPTMPLDDPAALAGEPLELAYVRARLERD